MNTSLLLLFDGLINLILGALLLIFPSSLVNLLGIPEAEPSFYPSILGAVLIGIGIALLIQRFGSKRGLQGLALPGAIAINLCGGTALAGWLLFGKLSIPLRGTLFLWSIVLVLAVIGGIELLASQKRTTP